MDASLTPPPLPGGRTRLPLARATAGAERQNSCFFRSGPHDGHRKALIKITDRCDLHCAHCFVSATKDGSDLPVDSLTPEVLQRFVDARVSNVTLTGGEPFVHPDVLAITSAFVSRQMDVTLCTNATSITEAYLSALVALERVRVNVSLDGLSEASHGRFRGNRRSFDSTLATTRALSAAGLLKGILCTPNALATPDEYVRLYELAAELGAQYLLMNPLSSFGRGTASRLKLEAGATMMKQTRAGVTAAMDKASTTEAVFIRFPEDPQTLAGCIAADILYVFPDGETSVCPHLIFAARNPDSLHDEAEFMIGNILRDESFIAKLESFQPGEKLRMGDNATCGSCPSSSSCGKGCPAAVIAAGGRVGDLDVEACPLPAAQPVLSNRA